MNKTTDPRPLLEVKNLEVDYLTNDGAFSAVKKVNFHINEGEVFGLAGESGCGKSTIAFAVTRLHKPPALISGGQIIFHGTDVVKLTETQLREFRWTQIAMVFQSAMNSLNPVLRLEEQFCDVIMTHTDMTKEQAIDRAMKLMDIVKIPRDRLRDYPHQFSGGMRQRLVIAICLALNAKLIVMDEPTTALDVVVQREILQQIYQLKEEFGFSILFITHDLSLMTQFCDRIGVMYQGELVEVNESQEIRHNPQHPYTQKLWSAFPSIHEGRKHYTKTEGFEEKLITL